MAKQTQSRPVLAVLLGRGGTGKSTMAMELVSRAQNAGRDPIIVDGDLRSNTLAQRHPDAMRPATEDLADSKAMMTDALNAMLEQQRSAVVDLGGGDRLLMEYGADLPMVEFCASAGIDPVAIYVLGPEAEDLSHAYTIWKGGYFRPDRTVFVLNEGAIRLGRNALGAFTPIVEHPHFVEMSGAGAKGLLVTRLAAMEMVKRKGLDLYRVADAAGGAAVDPVHGFMVRAWVTALEAKRRERGVDGWMP